MRSVSAALPVGVSDARSSCWTWSSQSGPPGRAVIDGRFVGERAIGDVDDQRAALAHAKLAAVGDHADLHGVQIPLLEDGLDLVLASGLDDHQHALLRLGEHDLVGRHAGLALRDVLDVDLDADAAAAAHLAGGTGQPGGAHVLDADERAGLHDLETRLEQELLGERVAHLDGRALLFRLLVELGRRHRRAVDAVAAGLGADVVHGVAGAAGRALDDVVVPGDAEAEHVDQRVAVVRLVEGDLAADRRDADAVAVAADAGDHAFEDAAVERHVRRTEPQRVQQRHRPRAHREDVADDAANAGRRALVRLDERRVVVRLDLEDRRQPVADVDRAGVLARPLQHAAARGGQRLQVHARALVAAVLGPHHREDAELGEVGLAAHQLADAVVLVGGDAVTFECGLVECEHG